MSSILSLCPFQSNQYGLGGQRTQVDIHYLLVGQVAKQLQLQFLIAVAFTCNLLVCIAQVGKYIKAQCHSSVTGDVTVIWLGLALASS